MCTGNDKVRVRIAAQHSSSNVGQCMYVLSQCCSLYAWSQYFGIDYIKRYLNLKLVMTTPGHLLSIPSSLVAQGDCSLKFLPYGTFHATLAHAATYCSMAHGKAR
jgi:hypothetical protein